VTRRGDRGQGANSLPPATRVQRCVCRWWWCRTIWRALPVLAEVAPEPVVDPPASVPLGSDDPVEPPAVEPSEPVEPPVAVEPSEAFEPSDAFEPPAADCPPDALEPPAAVDPLGAVGAVVAVVPVVLP
jgi:hypothetical protein